MKPIKVLVNADDVIGLLSTQGPLTPAEIAERVQIPRPSVYRLLDGLNAIGLTEPLPDSRTQLSLRWLHLADRARASMREWRDAHGVLVDLVDRTGQTAYLSVLRKDEAVCMDWEQGRGIGVLVLKPGRTLPLNAGAAGRTLLAFSADIDAYLENSDRRRFTTKTLVDDAELRADAAATRARGFAISDEDVTDGIGAVGIPVRSGSGAVIGALSLAGLADDITAERDRLVAELRRSADQLERNVADA
ncbi:IclR family transcriptional regulator [Microbacterium allomyrinae]|uniref:IclR family transcriptional regulator n=1 Tax=Microbacterium allomyrinae TaxID=2830666 RepID=A0A9X1LTQ0_9MICO|nr:IclR family transcriptional regulator [Microbacterium allomyrinae]MCC2031536.1 IclR family transcriptional regulator [Microbacterium allomyrinae]